MNKKNVSKLWKIIQEEGDHLKDKLPKNSSHPQGRNSYTHVSLCVKKILVSVIKI